VFTGDNPGGSGELLFEALHRAGYSPRRRSIEAGDGLLLKDAYIAAVNRCAPPGNRPTTEERDHCLPYLGREIGLLTGVRVIVALGGYAWDSVLRQLAIQGHRVVPRPGFGHGAEVQVGPFILMGCYHPSQQNTFTGRLTADMLDAILARARSLAEARIPGARPVGAHFGDRRA
jgi:uracil-DNA glycosylase family 4